MKKFSTSEIDEFVPLLNFSKIEGNLIPVVTQDYKTKEILMLAFANKEAVRKTLETGYAHFFSRSRNTLWKKGETSGHVEEVESVVIDCDNDSLLLKVKQVGAACHEGYDTCFYRKLEGGMLKIIGKKVFNPEDVYKK
jgi:phosphoribosyl-AMP cyclohydrolase